MPTDTLEMLEFFETAVLARAGAAAPAGPAESYLTAPGAGAEACTTLAALLGGEPDPMAALAAEFEAAGETALAALARDINGFLHDHAAALETEARRRPRLLEYVYPVV